MVIIMLHLACSFRPMQVWEHTSRTKLERKPKQKGDGDNRRAYLQLPENLWLAAGLEVLQSLGPEAVFLVQGAMATRGADKSMTMQEPKHESSPAVWMLVLHTKAAWEMQFFFGAAKLKSPSENLSGPQWGFNVKSFSCNSSKAAGVH